MTHKIPALLCALALGACTGDDTKTDDPFRPESGDVTLDLTDATHAEWFMANAKPFYRVDNENASSYVYMEWREDWGVCLSVSTAHKSIDDAVIGSAFQEGVNKWGTDDPIEPREETLDSCDSCTGITIPYFSPQEISLTLSSINITDDNLSELFVGSPDIQDDLIISNEFSRGFIGLLTRVPAKADGENVIADITSDSTYEIIYIRPANGDTTPGDYYGGNPYTAVQYGATLFEWFVTRSQAYEEDVDEDGNPIVLPVFEGSAEMNFGDTATASLITDQNVLTLPLDSSDQQSLFVNGTEAVSAVTGEAFDRTLLGGFTPINSEETTTVLYTAPGTYGCVQSIELTL